MPRAVWRLFEAANATVGRGGTTGRLGRIRARGGGTPRGAPVASEPRLARTGTRLAGIHQMGGPHPVLRQYCHTELPAWRRMASRALCREDWKGCEVAAIRPHGFKMELDLSQFWERWSYLVGRYYETHTQRILLEVLRKGEALIDVGANIGHVTLTGAWRVGPRGRVISFEPNPSVFERLSAHVRMNGLRERVALHNAALADRPGTLTLKVPVEGTGGATLGQIGSEYSGKLSESYDVKVEVGDELCGLVDGPAMVKVDVEGYEVAVLKGLRKTIGRLRPAMLVECWPEHLKNAGSSVQELFDLATEWGYQVFSAESPLRVRGFTRTAGLVLRRLRGPAGPLTDDVLWLHPKGVHYSRMQKFIRTADN